MHPMKSLIIVLFLTGSIGLSAAVILAQGDSESKPIKATFQLTGLHCPPCMGTVERSIKSQQGVRSFKIDWASKNAVVEFDQQQMTAQQLAKAIAATPHMMGGNMKYSGMLVIRVPDIASEGNAEKVKTALANVEGVAKVTINIPKKSVGVAFSDTASVTTTQLIEAMKDAGLEASMMP
jgi:copper ion binding protein